MTDVGSSSCGPFQIKRPYWIDCGSPGGGKTYSLISSDSAKICVGDVINNIPINSLQISYVITTHAQWTQLVSSQHKNR